MLALLLATTAHAATCCTVTGVDPLSLGETERVAVVASTAVQGTTTDLESSTSLGFLWRPTRWGVVGLRIPVILTLDHTGLAYGLGHPYAWLRLETRPTATWLGTWTVGLGSVGPEQETGPGSLRLETGPSVGWSGGGDFVIGQALVKVPVVGDGTLDVDADLVVARAVPGAQVGGRLSLDTASWQGLLSGSVSVGPSVWLERPGRRVALWATVSPPPAQFGTAKRWTGRAGLTLFAQP